MIKLHDFQYSGHAHAVRLLLSILGLEYESVPVDLMKGEQRGAAFRAINSFGTVPVLEDDGEIIWDSHAILVYLARKYGDGNWLPENAIDLARVNAWLSVAAGELYRGLVTAFIIKTFKAPYDYERASKISRKLLQVMESRFSDADWLAVDRATIADLSFYPYIFQAPQSGISLDRFDAVLSWLDRVEALPGFEPMPVYSR